MWTTYDGKCGNGFSHFENGLHLFYSFVLKTHAMAARNLLVLLLVVLAGCSTLIAPPQDPSPPAGTESPPEQQSNTTAPTDDNTSEPTLPQISVTGGNLATDPIQTFRRVTTQLGINSTVANQYNVSIKVITPENVRSSREPPRFLRVLGVQAPEYRTNLAGQTIGDDEIRINHDVATQPRIAGLLTHEYVHIVQHSRDETGQLFDVDTSGWDEIPPSGPELRLLDSSLTEGAATHVADQYQQAYTDTLPQGTRYRRAYEQRETAGGRYFMAPYWFGYRYVADRLEDNSTLASIYDQPPRTTEALVHQYDPGAEPPVSLPVNVTGDRWRPDDRGRVGELGTRIALSAHLNRSRAAVGADGWGNDALVPFERNSSRGYVWITRWDDTANASEFRTALTAALNQDATATEMGWRDGQVVFRIQQGEDSETVVVVAGPPKFARNTSMDINQRVSVQVR